MDFFQLQDAARKRTKWLVFLFVLAVVCIIAAVYVVVIAAMLFMSKDGGGVDPIALALRPEVMAAVTLGVLGVVGTGSLYKVAQLAAGGGSGVAESLGGRLISADTADLDERKLLNVVEEMAIASGMPVPPVYLLDDEEGVNAFAAGYAPGSAVIGVTRGAVERLSRDELQGVIAHEFSHILNGDMRLNIRLIGIIHGILVIGLIGYAIVRTVGRGAHLSRNRKNSPLPLIAIGLALIVIGYAGTFFGRLIKAAVSRQREFLADAAAVQFTRYPDGLAGALKKIGGYVPSSRIHHPQAEQASHLFFGQGLDFSTFFATHPPLPERIKRIQPSWDGTLPRLTADADTAISAAEEGVTPLASSPLASHAQRIRAIRERIAAEETQRAPTAIAGIGQPTVAHLDYAGRLLARIPLQLNEAARESDGARGIIYALLLQHEPELRRVQLGRLATHADRPSYTAALALSPLVDVLAEAARLPLVELAIPALRQLSPPQGVKFMQNIHELIKVDDRVELFEWALRRMVLKHLQPVFGEPERVKVRHKTLSSIVDAVAVLLSALAYVGHKDASSAESAYQAATATLGLALPMKVPEACDIRSVDKALDAAAAAAPLVKKQVLTACATCIITDARVTEREGELLRTIADALDSPMPPLLPGQSLV